MARFILLMSLLGALLSAQYNKISFPASSSSKVEKMLWNGSQILLQEKDCWRLVSNETGRFSVLNRTEDAVVTKKGEFVFLKEKAPVFVPLQVLERTRTDFLRDFTNGDVAVFQPERGTSWNVSTGKLLGAVPYDSFVSGTFSKHFLPFLENGRLINVFGQEVLLGPAEIRSREHVALWAVFDRSLVVLVAWDDGTPTKFFIFRKEDEK